jgi:hypothetical protein
VRSLDQWVGLLQVWEKASAQRLNTLATLLKNPFELGNKVHSKRISADRAHAIVLKEIVT